MVNHLILPIIVLVALQDFEPPSNSSHLKPFEFLIGGTWKAEGEISGFGKYSAERTYRWALDSNFIEQHHKMTLSGHKVEALGIIGWDSDKKQVVAYGFGNDGGIATTTASIEDTAIAFQGSRVGGFNSGPLRSRFSLKGDGEFVESVEIQKDGTWTPSFSFHWIRNSK